MLLSSLCANLTGHSNHEVWSGDKSNIGDMGECNKEPPNHNYIFLLRYIKIMKDLIVI